MAEDEAKEKSDSASKGLWNDAEEAYRCDLGRIVQMHRELEEMRPQLT